METKTIAGMVMVALALVFVSPCLAKAEPDLDVSLNPSNPWLGESVAVSAVCYDINSSQNITRVYADVTGAGAVFGDLDFNQTGNASYSLQLSPYILSKNGDYQLTAHCLNDAGETSNSTANIKVSKLAGYIKAVEYSPFFLGDYADIYFMLEKDGSPLTTPGSVSFEVRLNNQVVGYETPVGYYISKGWRLRITPSSIGQYDIRVSATYGGNSVQNTTSMEVKEPYKFEIISLDTSSITGVQPVSMRLKLVERDSQVPIRKEYLDIRIKDTSCVIDYVSQADDGYDVKVIPPSLSPNAYVLKITLNYKNYTKVIERNIYYTIPVKGEFANEGKGLSMQLTFRANSSLETVISTNNNGEYSGVITPGDYDIEVLDKTQGTRFILYHVQLNQYDDSIKYYHLSDTSFEGIDVGDVFVMQSDLVYESAYLEMRYNENNIANAGNAAVFECVSWNPAKKSCDSNWTKMADATVDSMRKVAKANVRTISSYAVGSVKGMSLQFELDKKTYKLDEPAKLTGILRDEDGKPVKDASITLALEGTGKTYQGKTDSAGSFAIDFVSPSNEGTYILKVTAGKSPYLPFTVSGELKAEKSKEITITAADSVRLPPGSTATYNISLKNTGQSDLYNIALSVTGTAYASLSESSIKSLRVDEERLISVVFDASKDGDRSTKAVVFTAAASNVQTSKTIAYTIIDDTSGEQNATEEPGTNQTISPTGFLFGMLEGVGTDAYIILLAILSIPAAYVLKKKRKVKMPQEREPIKNVLSAIDQEINRSESEGKRLKAKRRK